MSPAPTPVPFAPRTETRVPVQVAEVIRTDIEEVLLLNGTARLWDEFAVSSEIPGKVLEIHVAEGDWVKKGRLLAELDRVRRLLELSNRQAQVAKAEVDVEYARKNLQRGRTLFDRGAISQSELDQMEQTVKLSESALRLAEIAVEVIEDELEDTSILSPVAGQIQARHVSLGENVTSGAPLFTIIQYDPIKVITEVSEVDFYLVRTGQKVTMEFDALPQRRFQGRIHRIDSMANRDSGGFKIEIRVSNPGHRLRAGMVARISIQGKVHKDVHVAPLDALVETDRESTQVFVVEDGRARRVEVRIRKRIGARAILEGDLSHGDKVVTRGNVNLTDQTPVQVVP